MAMFLLCGCVTPQRTTEISKTFEFKDVSFKEYDAGINADLTRLNRFFGTDPALEAPHEDEMDNMRGWLGVVMKMPAQANPQSETDHAVSAVEIEQVLPRSPAEKAGLREGDRITAIDGIAFSGKGEALLTEFPAAIAQKHVGQKVVLSVLRKQEALQLQAVIEPYPTVKSRLKPHPDLDRSRAADERSLLMDALDKEGLITDYGWLLQQMRYETRKAVSPVVRNGDYNPFRLQEVNYVMTHPMDLPAVARKITDRLQGAYGKERHDLAGLMQVVMDELDMAYVQPVIENSPPADLAQYVERLVDAIRHANAERNVVLSVLSPDEVDFLYVYAPELLDEKPGEDQKKLSDAEERELDARDLRFLQLVLKLDLPRLMNASAEIARAIDLETLQRLAKQPVKPGYYPAGWTVQEKDNLTVLDTPAGKVLIGGAGDNTYTDDAALIIDLGGNDRYLNHAGGSTRGIPFSVVIDFSGNDDYDAKQDFAQGAGLLGGGFLIDLAGNDRYTAKNYAQGAGVLGTGMLVDLSGKDSYTAVAAGQGIGAFGAGILAEGAGDDRYYANVYSQGMGYIDGLGAIIEVSGNDNYFAGGWIEDFRAPGKSYKSKSQGFGFGMRPSDSLVGASGGIGVIAEAEGNDTYVADYFAQGSAYWFSLGILDDRKGNDRYIAGRYAQGAGIHLSAGVLIDGEGDDEYLASFGVAQGCGHDYGIGFLLDNGGNDRYTAGAIAQGAGNDNGIGVLSDNGGDDSYFLRGLGQGRGNFTTSRDLGSFGFLFDTGGGNDTYSLGGRNNTLNYRTQWGILLDTN